MGCTLAVSRAEANEYEGHAYADAPALPDTGSGSGRSRCGYRCRAHRGSRSRDSTLPQCTSVGGDQDVGTATTECATPGNVQINATAPDVPAYAYPWDDEFYGPALIMGGGAWGTPACGGGGGHR